MLMISLLASSPPFISIISSPTWCSRTKVLPFFACLLELAQPSLEDSKWIFAHKMCWEMVQSYFSAPMLTILPLAQLNSTLFNRNFTYIARKSIYTDKGASVFRNFMIHWCPPMGYGPSNWYGLWDMGEFGPFGREPTRWTRKSMGYRSLWVITGMD